VTAHIPVLLTEVLDWLEPAFAARPDGWMVDCTLGLGGHGEAALERWPEARLLGIDQDPEALERSARRLEPFGDRVRLVEGSFHGVEALATGAGVEAATGILADLGVSSMQLDEARRGFSFRYDGPLDMRMGRHGRTAADVVNEESEAELERIFREYGEERQARRIARAVVEARSEAPFSTTADLRDLIYKVKGGGPGAGYRPGREGRVDPATRVFQALRIEVNEELGRLESFLDSAMDLLGDEGRLVVISYHSLEDRIVKHTFRERARGEIDPITGRPREETRIIEVLTRKPVRPGGAEVAANPRSRSARLRVARRL
jgi:16S rRNA (cytosine1402-N4)-methyltransferase